MWWLHSLLYFSSTTQSERTREDKGGKERIEEDKESIAHAPQPLRVPKLPKLNFENRMNESGQREYSSCSSATSTLRVPKLPKLNLENRMKLE
jgi:hypothetical protein